MRELTKSMLSYTWAMSMFGASQMGSLLTPRSWDSASSSFEALKSRTEEQLGPVTRSTFRTGDNLQRSMVDLMFSVLNPRLLAPRARQGGWGNAASGWGTAPAVGSAGNAAASAAGSATNQLLGVGLDLLQQGVDVVSRAMSAVTGQGGGAQGQSGWGAVPPPPSA